LRRPIFARGKDGVALRAEAAGQRPRRSALTSIVSTQSKAGAIAPVVDGRIRID
jgi:hypothetical protein